MSQIETLFFYFVHPLHHHGEYLMLPLKTPLGRLVLLSRQSYMATSEGVCAIHVNGGGLYSSTNVTLT